MFDQLKEVYQCTLFHRLTMRTYAGLLNHKFLLEQHIKDLAEDYCCLFVRDPKAG